jgi:Protein of unknown function (DUF2752)
MEPLDAIAESQIGPLADRVISVLVLGVAIGFVWFLLHLTPDARGFGTHEQTGMPKCGWVVNYGKPCPTCGVTTAGAHLVRLQLFSAVKTQPFGATLGAFGLWMGVVAGWCLVRRRSYFDFLLRLPQGKILLWGLVLLLGSWLYTYLTFPPP